LDGAVVALTHFVDFFCSKFLQVGPAGVDTFMRKRGNGSTAPASSPGAAGKREFRGAMKNPPPPPTGAPSTLKVPNTASISDLSLDERAKIGRLVERLVQARDASERLTAENERLKESHTEAVAGIHAENISLQHENAGMSSSERRC